MLLPFGGLAVEAAVCGLAAVAAVARAARHRDTAGAAVSGPGAQGVLLVGTMFLTGSASAWPLPGAPAWAAAHRWWAVACGVLVVALVLANRDVGTRRRGARSRRPAG